jgi:hypothetical protein
MLLFENKKRTPKASGEDNFSFYDSSARPEYDVYRALLNVMRIGIGQPTRG